jgi:hypothetical protein
MQKTIHKATRIGSSDRAHFDGKEGRVAFWCEITYRPKINAPDRYALSITGVEGPKRNGDALGGCGQVTEGLALVTPAAGVDVGRFRDIWERWHLNDMRAGCEHQRATWDVAEELEVVSYQLTADASRDRARLLEDAGRAIAEGTASLHTIQLDATDRALMLLDDWFRARYEPPDADSPLSGCYEVRNRKTKRAGSTYPHEHPRGLLTKPCTECGYKYGSAWRYESVPDDVVAFLDALPDDTDAYPWRLRS